MEIAFSLAVLEGKGLVGPGCRGLGFGTGREPLPSVLAAAGTSIMATDAPADLQETEVQLQPAQWPERLEGLRHPNLVNRDSFSERVRFQFADMNRIPADLRGFDFCWSARAM